MHRNLGEVVTKSEVETSLQELKVLQTWFAYEVLRADEETGSSAILILPVGPGQPIYRDIYIPPTPRIGIDPLNFGAFLRIPQLVLPSMCTHHHPRGGACALLTGMCSWAV